MNTAINQEHLNASLRFLDKQGEATLEQAKLTNPELAEKLEKLGTLLQNEDFCQQLFACADNQAAVKLFGDNGLVLTEEEVDVLFLQIRTLVKKLLDNNGELSEEDLEQIAGGGWLGAFLGVIGGASAGFSAAAIGSLITIALVNMVPGIGPAIGFAIVGAVGIIGGGVAGGILGGNSDL